jgi:excinuclease ABC subunit C
MIRDGSEYLGPFTSSGKVRELLTFMRQHIQIRTCKLNLAEQQIKRGKYKLCLEYHLGNCKGPCVGLQTESDYNEDLQRLKNMLKGNLFPVLQHYRKEMKEMAENMQFEKAEMLKKKIEHLKTYNANSAIINPRLGDLDVFSIADEEDQAFVNFLMVRNGSIVDTHTISIKKKLEEEPKEILLLAIIHLREIFRSNASELVLPFPIDYPMADIQCTIPKVGDKRKLLELSIKNADYFKEEIQKKKALHLTDRSEDQTTVLLQLQEDLSLQELPSHIECFDNSNIQGSYPVSAMVCFKDGKPSNKEYRHYNVKTVQGIDDFATMKEVVQRRYRKLSDEKLPLPQMVIIDGGKGQLGAAMEGIEELGLTGKMTLIGLAKNVEEIFYTGDSESLKLPYDSPSLKLIRRIRDEVHRFGITFHRKQRSKGTFKNSLEEIKGIGKQSAEELLRTFKSVKQISKLSEEEIARVIGKAKARIVHEHFMKK